ncbi:MAG: hypothetical protein HY466_04230 [Deltaproteobacteria bacterium]|nr:hypothetical protein [Deltaproteobacteria bacterium]
MSVTAPLADLDLDLYKNSRVEREVIDKTPEEEIVLSGPDLHHSHYVDGTNLDLQFQYRSTCRKEWTETVREVEITTEERHPNPSCDEGDFWGVWSTTQVAFFFGVVGVGAAIGINSIDIEDDYDADTDRKWKTGFLVGTAAIGATCLSVGTGLLIKCSGYPKTTRTLLGENEEEKSGESYDCREKPLTETKVGLRLASGTLLEKTTDESGNARFDLAGAEPEDIRSMRYYLPDQQLSDPIALSQREEETLEYALAPKHAALLPVYGDLKEKARQAAIQCYEHSFKTDPVGGTIGMSMQLAPSGKVRKLSTDFNPGGLSAANRCLWKKISKLRFPRFQGESLAVNVSVDFDAPPPVVKVTPPEVRVYEVTPDAYEKVLDIIQNMPTAKWDRQQAEIIVADPETGRPVKKIIKKVDVSEPGYDFEQTLAESEQEKLALARRRMERELRLQQIERTLRELRASRSAPPPQPAPALDPRPEEPKKKVENFNIGGKPVTVVYDPSLGCTAGIAACQAAIMTQGGCELIRREARSAVGGWAGIVAGAAAGAVCDSEVQEICAKVVCE